MSTNEREYSYKDMHVEIPTHRYVCWNVTKCESTKALGTRFHALLRIRHTKLNHINTMATFLTQVVFMTKQCPQAESKGMKRRGSLAWRPLLLMLTR